MKNKESKLFKTEYKFSLEILELVEVKIFLKK